MNIAIIGGAGFLGTNLAKRLSLQFNKIKIVDRNEEYFKTLKSLNIKGISFQEDSYDILTNFDKQVENQDVVYHMVSTNTPGNLDEKIIEDIESNVIVTIKLLDACIRQNVKRIIFISSGGTVYGRNNICPINEDAMTCPISSYGIQKLVIEKVLYFYGYHKKLDYKIIRLANPYGPYQRPNGNLGVVTTFVYHALRDGHVEVYGDGSVVRDFIYIDDAITGMLNIAQDKSEYTVFNLGSGKGTSINEVINSIKQTICPELEISYKASRLSDVPQNYLDIGRYENLFGRLNPISLHDGIIRTAEFLRNH